jgi:hypothetical protein
MRAYLAARFQLRDEMRGVRDVLQALGHEVTSRWIDQEPDGFNKTNFDKGAPEAHKDLEDIRAADTLILFTEVPTSTGGYMVEFGYAMGLHNPLRLIVIGPLRNIFMALPQVEHYPDWSRFVMELSKRRIAGV